MAMLSIIWACPVEWLLLHPSGKYGEKQRSAQIEQLLPSNKVPLPLREVNRNKRDLNEVTVPRLP